MWRIFIKHTYKLPDSDEIKVMWILVDLKNSYEEAFTIISHIASHVKEHSEYLIAHESWDTSVIGDDFRVFNLTEADCE